MIYRRFHRDDKGAVIHVLHASFDSWRQRSEDHWTWKFEQNPHGLARIWVAEDGGRIAGCYIVNPVLLRAGVATILGGQAVDLAVHPDYRGRGVFTNLARKALEESTGEGVALVFAFAPEASFGGSVRAGYQPQFAVPKTYCPLVGRITRWRQFGDLALSEVKKFDSRFAVFASGRHGEISVQHDPEYLQWRYCENPARRYETIVCERDGDICGYCVLTANATRRLVSPGYVVDLQVVPGAESAAAYLASHSLRRLRSLGVQIAVSWERPTGPEQAALEACGFSSRYDSIRRRLTRRRLVEQFIAFEDEAWTARTLLGRQGLAGPLPWSLVPGDADYI